MVVRPHDAYDEEADRVRQIRRPQVRKFIKERSMLSDVGDPYINDEECDRDGEYPIGEDLYS
jgi:hypothetical protein